jgi:hypothetical protein
MRWLPCKWDSHGQFRLLRTPQGSFDALAMDANARGETVGSCGLGPLLWQGDVMSVLPVLPGQVGGAACAINDHGTIAGGVFEGNSPRGAIWQGMSLRTMLPTPSGAWGTVLTDIANDGTCCGWINLPGGITHAMKYVAGSVVDLGAVPGFERTELRRINRVGMALGTALPLWPGPGAPIVTIGSGIDLLEQHLDPATGKGWYLLTADDINDAGQIVALASDLENPIAIVLLTPMP